MPKCPNFDLKTVCPNRRQVSLRYPLDKGSIFDSGVAQVDAERNRILVRQLLEMYQALEEDKKTNADKMHDRKQDRINSKPVLKEKGETPPPIWAEFME